MKKIGRLERPDNFGSAKMFENPILERISRTHISIPITMFIGISVVLEYYAITTTQISWYVGLALFPVGFLAFTLVEYSMHKYFFHMEPNKN